MIDAFRRNQAGYPAIAADGFPIDSGFALDLPLTYLFVQQCLDRDLQRRLQNVHLFSPMIVNMEVCTFCRLLQRSL